MLKKIKTTVTTATALAFSAAPAFAAEGDFGSLPGLKGGDICGVIQSVASFALGIAGGIALILLIIGGIQYMTSGGDKIAVEASRGRITAAVVGLLIVFGAYMIVTLLGSFVEGFEICATTT